MAATQPRLLLPLLLLVGVLPASRGLGCDDAATAAFVKVYMESANSNNKCLKDSIDDFNDMVVASAVFCSVVSFLTCLTLLCCILYPLCKSKGSRTVRDSAIGCAICSSVIGGLCIVLPLLVRGIAWIPFFDSLCSCHASCLDAKSMACWRENADVTGQDHDSLFVLPITFGSIALLLSCSLAMVNVLGCRSKKLPEASMVATRIP